MPHGRANPASDFTDKTDPSNPAMNQVRYVCMHPCMCVCMYFYRKDAYEYICVFMHALYRYVCMHTCMGMYQ
jgi:hypothetical protein